MPKVKGPKDGTVITASFNGKSKSRFSSLKSTKDLVLLSIIGNEFCAGEYLGAIIQQAIKNHQGDTSGNTTFLLADQIYWHNLKAFDTSTKEEENLKAQALALGDKYFIDNLAYFLAPLGITIKDFNSAYLFKSTDEQIAIINQLIAKMGLNFEIMRWQTWIEQDSSQQLEKIMPLYQSVGGLRESIQGTVDAFAKRHQDKEGSVALWKYRSYGYITAESPAVIWLAAHLGYNFIIYPGSILPSFTATASFFIVKTHRENIVDGASIVDLCTHNEFSLHVDNPLRLAQWLEVNFQRSHPQPKVISSSKAQLVPRETGLSFFSTPINAETVKSMGHGCKKPKKVSVTEEKRNAKHTEQQPNLSLFPSFLDGVSKELLTKKSPLPSTKKSAPDLVGMFRGITQGIMGMGISTGEKVNILIQLTEAYARKYTAPVCAMSAVKKPSLSPRVTSYHTSESSAGSATMIRAKL